MGVNYTSYSTPRPDLGAAWQEYMSSAGFAPEFGALEIAPYVPVAKQAGYFSVITRETALTQADTKRASKAAYNRATIGAEDASYSCEEYGLEGVVDDRERALYASDFDCEQAILMQIARKVRLAQELRMKSLIFNTTTWTASALYTDVSSSAPFDTISSDVIGAILAAKEKVRLGTGMLANALIIARSQVENMLKNTAIRGCFPASSVISVDLLRNNLASIFGLEKLIILNAVYNTADEGQTASLSEVWTDDYCMVARVANQGDPLSEPCVARSFLWTADSSSELVVEQYREEQVRGTVLRCRHDVDEIVLGAAFGHLLKID